jgi:hypothetical protein
MTPDPASTVDIGALLIAWLISFIIAYYWPW